MRYVRIRSWHVVRTPTRMFDTYITRCNRTVTTTETTDVIPGDEKSCETCLRLVERDRERADGVLAGAEPSA